MVLRSQDQGIKICPFFLGFHCSQALSVGRSRKHLCVHMDWKPIPVQHGRVQSSFSLFMFLISVRKLALISINEYSHSSPLLYVNNPAPPGRCPISLPSSHGSWVMAPWLNQGRTEWKILFSIKLYVVNMFLETKSSWLRR